MAAAVICLGYVSELSVLSVRTARLMVFNGATAPNGNIVVPLRRAEWHSEGRVRSMGPARADERPAMRNGGVEAQESESRGSSA